MIHILVCDDEAAFAQDMERRILALPDYLPKTMTLQCLTDLDAINAEALAEADILFLDIDLGDTSGIELARAMRRLNNRSVLIFVTHFSEYAPEGYEVDAFRYLDKAELDQKLPICFSTALARLPQRRKRVEILCEGESVAVPMQSLVHVESQGHQQCLQMLEWPKEKLYTRLTMAQLEELLSPHGFLRIHKRYLVNMRYLQSLQSTGAILTTGGCLPASARNYRENKKKFVNWQVHLW